MATHEIVLTSTIVEIGIQQLPSTVMLGDTLAFGTTCYENGMLDILRGIAKIEFESKGRIKSSNQTNLLVSDFEKHRDKIKNSLSEEQIEVFEEHLDKLNSWVGSEGKDHFIEGFLSGFTLAKHLNIIGEE